MADLAESFTEQVRQARAHRTHVRIVGGDTKIRLGRRIEAPPLGIAEHTGILEYEPKELVLTARAGTPVAEIERTLETHGQQLGFEPPRFGPRATLGGTLASNLSGPARPWRGSVRDAVLGVRLVTGRGEHLRFGGKVMKNVAGFDVARLQAGAYGAFGIVTEISLRVLPKPECEVTLVIECALESALARMAAIAARPDPLSGMAWSAGSLHVRLAGTAAAVAAAQRRIGGNVLEPAPAQAFWHALKEHELPFFSGDAPLWRLSVKPSLPVDTAGGQWLIDWGGAQRFLRARTTRANLEHAAGRGHVSCLQAGPDAETFAQEPHPGLRALHMRLKQAFDPDRVLNPGRLYDWL